MSTVTDIPSSFSVWIRTEPDAGNRSLTAKIVLESGDSVFQFPKAAYGIEWRFRAEPQAPNISEQFEVLAREWLKNTRRSSRLRDMANDSAFKKIVQLGKPAIPLILRELDKGEAPWFLALHEIAGENQIGLRQTGNVKKINEAWKAWGIEWLRMARMK